MQHRLEGFHCGKPTLNHWLQHHARQAQTSGSARTFVVADEENRVAGCFSITVGQVDTVEASERIRQGMGRFPRHKMSAVTQEIGPNVLVKDNRSHLVERRIDDVIAGTKQNQGRGFLIATHHARLTYF